MPEHAFRDDVIDSERCQARAARPAQVVRGEVRQAGDATAQGRAAQRIAEGIDRDVLGALYGFKFQHLLCYPPFCNRAVFRVDLQSQEPAPQFLRRLCRGSAAAEWV